MRELEPEYLAKLKPESWPSPCFITDLALLRANAAILDDVQRRTGAKIMLALKGFAQWAAFPVLSRAFNGPLWGCCASSPDEARLAKEEFRGEVHAFAAGWSEDDMADLLNWADHVVFNSFAQWRRFRPMIDIVGMTTDPRSYQKLALSWGVLPALSDEYNSVDVLFHFAKQAAKDSGIVNKGDVIVITGGTPNGKSGNSSLINVETV